MTMLKRLALISALSAMLGACTLDAATDGGKTITCFETDDGVVCQESDGDDTDEDVNNDGD